MEIAAARSQKARRKWRSPDEPWSFTSSIIPSWQVAKKLAARKRDLFERA
jgi:hypothetical protein